MANEPAKLVSRTLSQDPVTEEDINQYLHELGIFLAEMRERVNESIERPKIPIFASSPITDDDFDPFGKRPPSDGVCAVSSTDNKLYVRVSGAYLAYTP